MEVIAIIGTRGVSAPRNRTVIVPGSASPDLVGIVARAGCGDYRSGDEIWCERLAPENYTRALNRDLLVPRPGGRFLFGRLINRESGRLHLLPLGTGGRQQVVNDPPWAAVAIKLVRRL